MNEENNTISIFGKRTKSHNIKIKLKNKFEI